MLFFRPITSDIIRCVFPGQNKVFCKSLIDCDRAGKECYHQAMQEQWSEEYTWNNTRQVFRGSIVLNPFLTEFRLTQFERWHITLANLTSFDTGTRPSWRRMLLSQPPLADAVADHCSVSHWHTVSAANAETGLNGVHLVESARAFETDHLMLAFKNTKFPRDVILWLGVDLDVFKTWESMKPALRS